MTSTQMPARRCPNCSNDYPPSYKICVLCGLRLAFVHDGSPLSERAIDRLRKAVRFEHYYEEREVRRLERGDPSPEELGSAEARAEVASIRKLNDDIRRTNEQE